MELKLYRNYFREGYIIGKLFIADDYFCDVLERPLIDKSADNSPCIPCGKYRVSLDVQSPKFKMRSPYKSFCNGYLPRLLSVPGHSGILIHIGNSAADSRGCLLVGKNTQVGKVLQSTKTFVDLYNRMIVHHRAKFPIYISIYNTPLDKQSNDLLKAFLHEK